MHFDREAPLLVAAKGLLAGMGGAIVLTTLVAVARTLLEERKESEPDMLGPGISAGQALAKAPGLPPNMNRVTATFVQKIATGIFGTSLNPDQQYLAGTAWHLAYGGFWGVLYALLQSSLAIPRFWLSLIYGLGIWAIGPGWLVPKMKLMLAPVQQRPTTTALVVAVHLAYGLIAALILRLLHKD
jgi:hypothetical protein